MKFVQSILLLIVCLFSYSSRGIAQGPPCNTTSCSVCDVSATITSISGGEINNNLSTIAGSSNPGETETSTTPLAITATECGVITIDIELDFNWHQGENINWIHGISFENSSGWLAAEGVIIPPDPGWLFMNSITGVCSSTTYDAGYYWDPPGTDCGNSGNYSNYDGIDCSNNNGDLCEGENSALQDGDPSDNWGIDCENDCPQFGFSLTYCPTESGMTNEVITFILTEDGETGGWNQSDGCIFTLSFPITINSAGVQLPDEDLGPICQDSCVTIDAGNGCDGYMWSTGETTSEIIVCPSVTTTYSVTVSSDIGCETSGDVTVIVEPCCNADAGILTANPSTLCPGETSNINVSDYQNDPAYMQVLIVVDQNGLIEEIITTDNFGLTSEVCAEYTIHSYSYITSEDAVLPQIGNNINTLNCDIHCCDLTEIKISFEDTEVPTFTNPPANVTLDCIDELPPMGNLEWKDNCIASGTSIGSEEQSHDKCNGGTVTRTWTAIDNCNNEVAYTQTITITPIEAPQFINLPQDETVDCSSDISNAQNLEYTNNQSGSCEISGSVAPTIEDNTTACGGTVIYSWEFTNECGTTIQHVKNVTITPPSSPEFINIPMDIEVTCGDIPSPSIISYSNGGAGDCAFSGEVLGTISGNYDECGGAMIQTWTYTDDCGNTINEEQVITVAPVTAPFWIDPPSDFTLECNGSFPDPEVLYYDNGEIENCAIQGSVVADVTENENAIEYTWTFTNECNGYTIIHNQIITIPEAPTAVDVSVNKCADQNGNATFDLLIINDQVNSNTVYSFQYFYTNEDAENNQNEVLGSYITNQPESTLIVKVSNNGCPSYATVTFLVDPLVDFEIAILCNDNGTANDSDDDYYTITILAPVNGSTNSTYDVIMDGNYLITLPYGVSSDFLLDAMSQTVDLTLQDAIDTCFTTQTVGPLSPCSDACSIGLEVTTSCDNGGSIGIPSDDVYLITFSSTGINNSAAGFTISIDGMTNGTYDYGVDHTITMPADGNIHQLIATDHDMVSCAAVFETEVFEPCSGTCSIQSEVLTVDCHNNNTNGDESDDTFTASITAETADGTGTYIVEPGGHTAQSGSTIEVGPFNISDGDIAFTISDSSISSCSTTVIIEAPLPCSICSESVEAGANGTLDCEVISVELSGSSSTVGGGMWTGPEGFEVVGYDATVDVAGMYYFTVDFGQECIAIDSLLISVSNEIPIPNAGPDDMLTCEVDKVTLEGTVIGGSGNFEYTWYDEAGEILANSTTFEATIAGNYYYEVKDLDTDCISPKDVVSVIDKTYSPTAIIYSNPGDILDCIIEVIYITNEVEPDVVYTWMINNLPSTAPSMTINEPSNIELYALDTISGCESSTSLNITSLEEYPIINMDTDEILNCENIEITIYGYTPTPSENIEYTWYNQNNEVIATGVEEINVSEEGTYYLELMDNVIGCSNRDTINIEGVYNYPPSLESEDYVFGCIQGQLNIGISVGGDSDNLNFKWITENGAFADVSKDSIATVLQAGEYIVTVIDQESQCGISDTIIVSPPEAIRGSEIEVLDESCDQNSDGVIILGDVVGGTGPYKYLFGDILQQDSIVDDLSAGLYSFIIIDAMGCRFDTVVEISVVEPFQVDLEAGITIQSGASTSLTVDVNIPEDEIGYVHWFPSIGLSCDSCITTTLEGSLAAEEYEVTVTNIYGCSNMASVRVIREETTKITFPNIISTNGDNMNNYFTAYSDDDSATVLSMKIFDRWGALMWVKDEFAPNIPQDGWDGTFSGQAVEQGVYVFLVEMEMVEGREVFSGDVTVVR